MRLSSSRRSMSMQGIKMRSPGRIIHNVKLMYAQIARAISRLEHAGLPLQHMFHNLNMWRESSRRS